MNTSRIQSNCQLCGEHVKIVQKDFLGYQEGSKYDIYACENCLISYAWPMKSDLAVYQTIYKNARLIPGYNRYFLYAENIAKLRGKKSFKYIAKQEPMYWPIHELLKSVSSNSKIMEIGSGLGYLTYALNEFGFDTIGVDISQSAVEQAIKRFGSYYQKMDIFNETPSERYDYIILSEVIEHVENPQLFIEKAFSFLKPEGKLFVTTPNKDYFAYKNSTWCTDLPPVHLWWFSEEGMQYIAKKISLKIEFFDYTSWHQKKFPKEFFKKRNEQVFSNKYVLKSNGQPLEPSHAINKKHGVFKKIKSIIRFAIYKNQIDVSKSTTIFAVFSKK